MRILALAVLLATAGCTAKPTPTLADLAYADQSEAQRLHLYLPKGAGPFPVVIMIHGGAFMFGDPDDAGPGFKTDVDALNADGIAVASIGYRLSGEAIFPAAVQDVKAAIRFVRAKAAEHRLDPSRIALWGKSAGAHLALMGGLVRGEPRFDDPKLGDVTVDDRVSAVVAFYAPVSFGTMDAELAAQGCKVGTGPMDGPHNGAESPESKYLGGALPTVPDRVALSDPIRYVTADAPPVYLSAGGQDCTVPPAQSRRMYDALRAKAPASNPQLFILPATGHGTEVFDQGASLERVRAFLKTHLREPLAAPDVKAALPQERPAAS